MSKTPKKASDVLLQIRADDFGKYAIATFRKFRKSKATKNSALFEEIMRVYVEHVESQKNSEK